ncbi:hypothetical protein V8J88_01990 [Massilia sp. W12]
MIFDMLRGFFFGVFNKLEKNILNAVSNALDEERRNIFRDQIERINLLRRDPNGNETIFYWMKRGKPCRDFPLMFSTGKKEVCLAKVHIRYYGRTLPALVMLLDGAIFRIKYSQSVVKFDVMDNFSIEDVKIFN